MTYTVTAHLRGELAKAGHTQLRVAALLGLSVRAVSDRFTGKTEWRWGEIVRLCEAYPSLLDILPTAAVLDAAMAAAA